MMEATIESTMNANQEIWAKADRRLLRLGFRRVAPNRWEKPVARAQMSVMTVDGVNPWLRCEWSDSQYHDVVFFDFGETARKDDAELDGLVHWAMWYAGGNHMSNQGTIGYLSAEPMAA